jgi:hypothetical protein
LPKDALNEVDLTKCITTLMIVGRRTPSATTTKSHEYGDLRRRVGTPQPDG